jgi:hypothetical protein
MSALWAIHSSRLWSHSVFGNGHEVEGDELEPLT